MVLVHLMSAAVPLTLIVNTLKSYKKIKFNISILLIITPLLIRQIVPVFLVIILRSLRQCYYYFPSLGI